MVYKDRFPPRSNLYILPHLSALHFQLEGIDILKLRITVIQDPLKIKRSEHMHSFF